MGSRGRIRRGFGGATMESAYQSCCVEEKGRVTNVCLRRVETCRERRILQLNELEEIVIRLCCAPWNSSG